MAYQTMMITTDEYVGLGSFILPPTAIRAGLRGFYRVRLPGVVLSCSLG